MSTDVTQSNPHDGRQKLTKRGLQLPSVIEAAGEKAQKKFIEFFIAEISNENTRKAYGRAVLQFFDWCEERDIQLRDIEPNVAAIYVRTHGGSDATANWILC